MKTRIKTVAELEKIVGNGKGYWFLAMVDSDLYTSSATRKDMAALFEEGIKPIRERADEVLSTLGENIDGGDVDYPTAADVRTIMKEMHW